MLRYAKTTWTIENILQPSSSPVNGRPLPYLILTNASSYQSPLLPYPSSSDGQRHNPPPIASRCSSGHSLIALLRSCCRRCPLLFFVYPVTPSYTRVDLQEQGRLLDCDGYVAWLSAASVCNYSLVARPSSPPLSPLFLSLSDVCLLASSLHCHHHHHHQRLLSSDRRGARARVAAFNSVPTRLTSKSGSNRCGVSVSQSGAWVESEARMTRPGLTDTTGPSSSSLPLLPSTSNFISPTMVASRLALNTSRAALRRVGGAYRAPRVPSSTRFNSSSSSSSSSHSAVQKSDAPWAIASAVVFGSLFVYATSPASKTHNEHGHVTGGKKPAQHGAGSAASDDKTGDDAVWKLEGGGEEKQEQTVDPDETGEDAPEGNKVR